MTLEKGHIHAINGTRSGDRMRAHKDNHGRGGRAEVLVDVTRTAAAVGFTIQVAMRRDAFLASVVRGADGADADDHIQSLRLWDVLYTAWRAVVFSSGTGAPRSFELRQPARHGVVSALLRLQFICRDVQGQRVGIIEFSGD
jgi:hypothetical protein